MAASLIAQSQGDPFWSNSARLVFSETCESFLKSGKTDMKDLIDILLKIPLEEFNKYLKESDSFATSAIDPKSKGTAQSIRSVLTSYVNCLKFTLDNQGDFSVRDWIKNDNIDNFLFLSSSADKQQTLKPLTSLWLDIAINNILTLDQEIPRKIWIIIDELPSLQYLPSLDTGISEARQFGGCFVVSTQSMARLKEVYGNNMTESLSVNCKNRLVFGAPNQETATWCARDFGNSETMSNKDNISFGANEIRDVVSSSQNKELVNLVLPSQIMNLENLEFYVKMGSFDAAKSKLKYKKRQDIASKIIEREDLMITSNSIKKDDKKEERKQKESKKDNKTKKGSKSKTSAKATKKSKDTKSNDLSQDEDFVSDQYWEGIAQSNTAQTNNDTDSKKETSIKKSDNNQEDNQENNLDIIVDEVDEDGVVTQGQKDQKASIIEI
jgi:type IV secretory pathway TraG/TraD family ATPase VirD4